MATSESSAAKQEQQRDPDLIRACEVVNLDTDIRELEQDLDGIRDEMEDETPSLEDGLRQIMQLG